MEFTFDTNHARALLFPGADWAILSADRKGRTPEQNHLAATALADRLGAARYAYAIGTGFYEGQHEIAFFVRHIDTATAARLANSFDHDTILTPAGLRSTNACTGLGTLLAATRGVRVYGPDEAVGDEPHTTIDGVTFSLILED